MGVTEHTFPPGWGVDVFTKDALDMLKIAVLFGGFPKQVTVNRILLDPKRKSQKVNVRTVERVLQEMRDEQRAKEAPTR